MPASGRKGISAAVLKNIAVITMTIDHATAFLLKSYLQSTGIQNPYDNEWYWLGRVIGRIAFVLYAFMIAEGAYHTRSKIKYAARLLVLAVISVIPHSYVNAHKLFNPKDLNIFFLLFFGLITIFAYEWLRNNIKQLPLAAAAIIAVIAISCYISLKLNFEYGMMGILLIVSFYVFRYDMPKMITSTVIIMSLGYMANVVLHNGGVKWIVNHQNNLLNSLLNADRIQIFGLLALPLILLYNGQKGKQLPKAFYYLFYPVHLGIIALIMMI